MFSVDILSTADEEQWLHILQRFDHKDPHYLPGYLRLFESEEKREIHEHFGGQGYLFTYGDSDNLIVYPFFKRSIGGLSFSDSTVDHLYDIVSPYGYGGPLAQINDPSLAERLWKGFFNAFDRFCEERNIVSEFCRLHPVYENHIPMRRFSGGDVECVGQIVYVDLTVPEEDLMANMRKHNRRLIRKAAENPNLVASFEFDSERIREFFDIYVETMERREALREYMFSLDFFNRAFEMLGESLSLAYVTHQGQMVSGLINLRYGELSYNWLSGGKREYFNLFTNGLLRYENIMEARRQGYSYCILGGGVSAKQDSLFEFKASFSRLTRDFYVYKKVHLPQAYGRLIELRNGAVDSEGDFFPGYRTPEPVGVEG